MALSSTEAEYMANTEDEKETMARHTFMNDSEDQLRDIFFFCVE